MGRNNLERKTKDVNWGFNVTQNRQFKFELLSEKTCRNFEISQGLEFHKLSMTIRINANRFKVKQNDKLNIKGKVYLAVAISDSFDNWEQGRFKGSLNDFTGGTIIGLE